jgi:hypothetical protein
MIDQRGFSGAKISADDDRRNARVRVVHAVRFAKSSRIAPG